MVFGSSFALCGGPRLLLWSSGVLPGRSSETLLDFWGALLGLLGAVGSSWVILGGSLGTPRELLGGSWGLLGRSWGVLVAPGGRLGGPWGVLGRFGGLPGCSFGVLGCLEETGPKQKVRKKNKNIPNKIKCACIFLTNFAKRRTALAFGVPGRNGELTGSLEPILGRSWGALGPKKLSWHYVLKRFLEK